jgi:hypothetical protein
MLGIIRRGCGTAASLNGYSFPRQRCFAFGWSQWRAIFIALHTEHLRPSNVRKVIRRMSGAKDRRWRSPDLVSVWPPRTMSRLRRHSKISTFEWFMKVYTHKKLPQNWMSHSKRFSDRKKKTPPEGAKLNVTPE